MTDKTLVLIENINLYYFSNIHLTNVEFATPIKKVDGLYKWIFKALRKCKLPLTKFFYDSWYMQIDKYNKIILFDVVLEQDPSLLKNILNKTKDVNKYIYFWNIIHNNRNFKLAKKFSYAYKLYSYDRNDCRNFGLRFNTIMYDDKLTFKKVKNVEFSYDIFFLGFMKDKRQKMLDIYMQLKESGLIGKFLIVGSSELKYILPFEFSDKYIGYYLYLDMLSRSKAVLDITQENQDGFSMRVMESIFLGKKLVSTNTALYEADFYNPNNILILDENSQSNISEFLNKPFMPYPKKFIEYYSFSSWLDRFCE